jgi:ketosteroid isomerase-like protein
MTLTPARAAIAIVLAASISTTRARAQDSKVHVVHSVGPTQAEFAKYRAEDAMKSWVTSWNAHDTTALFRMLPDKVSLLFPDSLLAGRAAVEQWMHENVSHTSGLRITPLYSGGDPQTSVYQTGRWRLATGPGAKSGVYTFVFTKADEGWKVRSMYILGDPGLPSR